MRYNNYTNDAIYELERQRTLNYGNNYNDYTMVECENCTASEKTIFKIGNRLLCEDCICNYLRDCFEEIEFISDANNVDVCEIFKNIIYDFTDSELITYVENLYEKAN